MTSLSIKILRIAISSWKNTCEFVGVYCASPYTAMCVYGHTQIPSEGPEFLRKQPSLSSQVQMLSAFCKLFLQIPQAEESWSASTPNPCASVEIHGHISIGSVPEKKYLKSCMGSCMRSYVLLQQYGTKMEPGKGVKWRGCSLVCWVQN